MVSVTLHLSLMSSPLPFGEGQGWDGWFGEVFKRLTGNRFRRCGGVACPCGDGLCGGRRSRVRAPS